MGIHENARLEKRDKARAKREAAPPWSASPTGEGAVSWLEADMRALHSLVATVCDQGCSVQLTRTRDGGALGIRVYDDALEAKTVWARPGTELTDLISAITKYYEERGNEGRRG